MTPTCVMGNAEIAMRADQMLQELLRDLFLSERELLGWAWEELGVRMSRGSSRRRLAAGLAGRILSLGLLDEELFWGLAARFPMRVNRIRETRNSLLGRASVVPDEEPLLHGPALLDAEESTVDEPLPEDEDELLELDPDEELPELELDDLSTDEDPRWRWPGRVVAKQERRGFGGLGGLMEPIVSLG